MIYYFIIFYLKMKVKKGFFENKIPLGQEPAGRDATIYLVRAAKALVFSDTSKTLESVERIRSLPPLIAA